jgi:acyl-CoA dehydrogenase
VLDWLARRARERGLVPRISPTEREALEAGSVWVEADLFSGRPDIARLLREPWPELSEEERTFLDGPVEEACRLVDPWEEARTGSLPPGVLDFLRANRFFGLTIPKAYGGKAFSPLGCSAVFGKLASRSLGLSTLVLIPNSVGPAELLLAHGTDEQRLFYLPRLARGDEIPCFALTEPEAGSDAASLRSQGVVFEDAGGRLMLRLSFRKRYITLAPIATLVGLAVRVRDPQNRLGRGEDPGITFVLVPADTPGVDIGRRHDPMGVPFPNGPVEGEGVVVPLDQVIGGAAGVGRGWGMLMEALAGGRAISLPAQSAAGIKLVARGAGAYAGVRKQFGLPVARFEGVAEPLARLAGLAYAIDAARVFTCGAVARGAKPAVASALLKYQSTEAGRRAVADGMDVMAGAAICLGPRNLLARGHMGAPIGITVEGANILTRTLIVYAQGALRCRPHALAALRALESGDGGRLALSLLRQLLSCLGNLARTAVLDLTGGWSAVIGLPSPLRPHARRLVRASARFAVLSDLVLVTHGPRLKQAGHVCGRMADALSEMYLALAALRRFEAEGRREEDRPLLDWSVARSLASVQSALDGVLANARGRLVGLVLRGPLLLWCRLVPVGQPPADGLADRLARVLTTPGPQRDRLTSGLFLPEQPAQPLGRLERALDLVTRAGEPLDRIRRAGRDGRLPAGEPELLLEPAVVAGVVTTAEADLVRAAKAAREDAIEVDSFGAARVGGAPEPAAAVSSARREP